MNPSELEHGAIYELKCGKLVRCNISCESDEYWFTYKNGGESSLTSDDVLSKVADKDDSFKNNDIK